MDHTELLHAADDNMSAFKNMASADADELFGRVRKDAVHPYMEQHGIDHPDNPWVVMHYWDDRYVVVGISKGMPKFARVFENYSIAKMYLESMMKAMHRECGREGAAQL